MFDSRKYMELQNLHGVEDFRKLTIPQMLGRGKLIELLQSSPSDVMGNHGIGALADHLIANDVVRVVRCKDCKHYGYEPYDNGDKCCERWGEWIFPHEDDFCSCGERKDNET